MNELIDIYLNLLLEDINPSKLTIKELFKFLLKAVEKSDNLISEDIKQFIEISEHIIELIKMNIEENEIHTVSGDSIIKDRTGFNNKLF